MRNRSPGADPYAFAGHGWQPPALCSASWLLLAVAAWLNCTPSVGAAPAAYEMSPSSSSGSGVVPGPGTGIAGALDALGSWDWMFNAASNGSSTGNSTNSSAAAAAPAEPPAVAAAGRGP
jgi:hypothetical protein